MKNITTKITAAIIAAAAALTFAACSESSSDSVSKKENSSYTNSSSQQQEDRLISFSVQPGGDMTQEEFEKRTTSYMVYTDGRVVDEKTGEEKKLTEDELAKLKEFADGIINKTVKMENTQGADMPSETVIAYDEKGTHQLTAASNSAISGYDDVYSIVREKFCA